MTDRIRLGTEPLFLSLALGGVAVFGSPYPVTVPTVQLFCLLYASYALAASFFPEHTSPARLFLTGVTLIGAQSILQTILYYLLPTLGVFTDILTQILAIITLYSCSALVQPQAPFTEPQDQLTPPPSPPSRVTFQVLRFTSHVIALVGISFIIFHAHLAATIHAIRTPWTILPPSVFLAFSLIVGALWLLAWSKRSSIDAWIIASGFFVSLALMTVLIYPLGFGFDGFLHRESERLLLTTGTLHPKPFYYIGQYVFTTWLARTLALPVEAIDPFLLVGLIPLLAATLTIKHSRSKGPHAPLLILALVLLVPLKPWIATTPQSFAYLIGLSGLLLSVFSSSSLVPPLVFGIWSAMIHPLAGLPLFGGIVLVLWRNHLLRFPSRKLIGSLIISAGIALIVPLAFFVHNTHTGGEMVIRPQTLISSDHLRTLQDPFLPPPLRISIFADWSSFVDMLFPLLLVLFACLGTTRWLVGAGLLTIFVAWFMREAVTFPFLISYEQQDYASRLILVGQLLLLPAALEGLARVWHHVKRGPAFSLYSFIFVALSWQAGRIYHAFPYHDATHIEHGWNVSAADEEAVRWIDRDSGDKPYTVLANQSVSAAAIAHLGFKRYAGDVFFYPVPTGGPLYQIFLRATKTDVTQEDIREAARLSESDRVYVVLNDYWWQADDVARTLEHFASATHDVEKGRDRIYRFDITKERSR